MKAQRTLVALLVCVWLLGACAAVGGTRYVERLTLDNPSEYGFSVDVSDGRSGWLSLGEVKRESEDVIEEVIDMGKVWVFRFSFHGRFEEQITIDRTKLRAEGWRVSVPETLIGRLRASGEPPSFRGR